MNFEDRFNKEAGINDIIDRIKTRGINKELKWLTREQYMQDHVDAADYHTKKSDHYRKNFDTERMMGHALASDAHNLAHNLHLNGLTGTDTADYATAHAHNATQFAETLEEEGNTFWDWDE